MPRKTKADAIYLSKNGVIILFAVLGVIFMGLAIRLVIPEKSGDEEPVILDIEAEREAEALPYKILSQTPSPPGSDSGAFMEISVSCDIGRAPLIATVREALVAMYISHPDHICHGVNVYLDGLTPPVFSPVVEARLCKGGYYEEGQRIAPWAFHIRLLPESQRDHWGFDPKTIRGICEKLAEANYCPWDAPRLSEEAIRQVAERIGSTDEEAAKLLRQGQNLVSDNYNYRRALR